MNKWTLAIGWLLTVVGTLWFSSYIEPNNGKSTGLNTAWSAAILCVAIFNTFNYGRHAFRVKVFRCFGRVALSYK